MSDQKQREAAARAEFAAALAGEVRERDSARGHREHKTRQLCRQVQRALNLSLSERGAEAALEGLYVEAVLPAPGCAHVLVEFVAAAGTPLPEVLAALAREAPRLRASVARAISRKRAPELSFVPAMGRGGADG